MSHWSESLVALNACSEAIAWSREQSSAESAWASCERGDWMLWLLGRTCKGGPWSDERKPLALVAADCAELALPHASGNRQVAEECIAAVRKWTAGTISREEVMEKRRDAYAAATAAAAYAAYAAAAAAAAYAAAAAAAYAADAAADAAAYAARKRVLREAADIVRRHFPAAPVLP